MTEPEGHRERLRLRFLQNPGALSAAEHLELLLTYAIPRRDVSPLAEDLISRFGSLEAILSAADQELMEIDGIGESTITFLRLLTYLVKETQYPVTENSSKSQPSKTQLNLFELEPGQNMSAARKAVNSKKPEAKKRARQMVRKMKELGFGNCSNEAECEAECPKGISIREIARLNREFIKAEFS